LVFQFMISARLPFLFDYGNGAQRNGFGLIGIDLIMTDLC
jgi:hypothetical protein